MFANTQMGGTDMAFPDVCLTPAPPAPPVPIPYPNTGMGNTAVPPVNTVLFSNGPAHNLNSVIPLSNGDNAGVATGVASGMVMGPVRHTSGSSKVMVGGMPGSRLTSPTMQNSTNASGARLAPSQTKVMLLG